MIDKREMTDVSWDLTDGEEALFGLMRYLGMFRRRRGPEWLIEEW